MTVRLADSDTTVPIEGMCKIKLTLHGKHTIWSAIWVTTFVLPILVHGVSISWLALVLGTRSPWMMVNEVLCALA